jgi:hypothetical protein
MRGLVTAGRLFGWNASAGLESGRDLTEVGLPIVVSRIVPRAATKIVCRPRKSRFGYCMTAKDQAQPASSRATATFAITGFFRRAVKPCQR